MDLPISTDHLFSSSSHLMSNTITLQHFDSKLTAFYTILTVALSIMLSFKQSRYILINATTTYPIRNVKKCIRRLKCLKTGKRYENADELIAHGGLGLTSTTNGACDMTGQSETAYYRYIRFLKLKRLRSFASNIKYITTNTLKLSSNNYLYKTLNATFSKMKRTATVRRSNNYNEVCQASGSSTASSGFMRRHQSSSKTRFSKTDAPVSYTRSLLGYSSMTANDFSDMSRICNTNRGMIVRSKTLPKIKFSKVLFS